MSGFVTVSIRSIMVEAFPANLGPSWSNRGGSYCLSPERLARAREKSVILFTSVPRIQKTIYLGMRKESPSQIRAVLVRIASMTAKALGSLLSRKIGAPKKCGTMNDQNEQILNLRVSVLRAGLRDIYLLKAF
jgi:hypothetical protein